MQRCTAQVQRRIQVKMCRWCRCCSGQVLHTRYEEHVLHRFRGSEVQRFRGSEVQRFRGAEVQVQVLVQ